MCVTYDNHKPILDEDYWKAFPDPDVKEYPGRYAVRITNDAPIIWHDSDEDRRRISLFEFSMVPSWAKEQEISKMRGRFVNARDDKLLESRLWKPRFETQRCLIPANGFYEPHRYPKEIRVPGGPKPTKSIPFYFKLKSTDHFAFAGLYDSWKDPEGRKVIDSFAIVTTSPNNQMEKIHNGRPRQPVILSEEDYDFWLDPTALPKDFLDQNIFTPWPDEDMVAWQVTKQLDYGENSEELIKPVEEQIDIDRYDEPEQGWLF